jgi:mRNA-degrading endonuclease HigB of HigAB toxin-antitoxin module
MTKKAGMNNMLTRLCRTTSLFVGATSRLIASCARSAACCLLLALAGGLHAQTITTKTIDFGSLTTGQTGQHTSQAVINGNPAIAYYNVSDSSLMFARNSAVDGSGAWAISTLDYAGTVGQFVSLAVVNGNPAISYYSSTSLDLKYVRATDANGTSWGTPMTLDSTGDMGLYTSLAVVNGNPAISYHDLTNGDLKYLRATDANGTSWGTPVTLDSTSNVGFHTSLAVVNGNPAISYYDVTNLDLKYVRATTTSGTLAGDWGTPVTLDSTGDVGLYTSLEVVNGNPAISYYDQTNGDLKYVRATTSSGTLAGNWGTPVTLDTSGGNVGSHTSLAVVNGNPAISYYDQANSSLKYMRATTASGTLAGDWGTPVTTDNTSSLGTFTSLAVVNGNPAISYYDFNSNDLKFIRASDASGTTWAAATTADSGFNTGNTGQHTSQAIINGNPAIAYYDVSSENLMYVRAGDAGGTTWGTPVAVDSTDVVGMHTSLMVVNGNPAISYYDTTNLDLKYVRASDASGTSWGTPVTLDSTGQVGQFTSLAVVNGNPAVSYYDGTNFDLKYVRATDASGTTWGTPVTLDSLGNVGLYTSLAVVNGNPAISYYDDTNANLKYVRASNASGTSWGTPVTLDSANTVGLYTSLAVVNGNPVVSYYDATNGDLKYLRSSDASGASWGTPQAVDSTGVVGFYTSLEVISGNPAISYYDFTNQDLKYVRASDASGTSWGTPVTLDSTGDVGQYNSLVAINGNPTVSYYDNTNGNLKWGIYGAPPAPEINVQGNGLDIASGDTTPVTADHTDFGSVVTAGAATIVRTFTVQNTGTANLTLSGSPEVAVSGTHAADFTVTTQPSSPVAAAGSTTFTVTFDPSAGGLRTATLTIASDDADEGTFDFAIQGTGIVPTVTSLIPNSGSTAGGTVVTIYGTGFTGATAVSFGGTAAASFTVNNATRITAITPAHTAGAVSVLVTTPNGTNAANSLFTYSSTPLAALEAYIKSGNTGPSDDFGYSVALSGDTAVVGAPAEDSSTTGVNSTPNQSAPGAGAAYVFVRSGGVWTQQAYLKASNTSLGDDFGWSVAVAGDTVVVGAVDEASSTTGVNSTPNESTSNAGAAYVFTRSGGVWTQQAYLKASNTGVGDRFGHSVAVVGDTVVVGAAFEDSSTTGINSTADESASNAGAAYVFTRSAGVWTQQAYLKASNTGVNDRFGGEVAVAGDTVVVGASEEDSSTTGVNSTSDESTSNAGAAYVFTRSAGVWTQQAYLKSSNTGVNDNFGFSVGVAGDTVVVGAHLEDSSTTGVNSTPDDSANSAGAAYVFTRSAGVWTQQAYLKASNTGAGDRFGQSVAVSGDAVVVGAIGENSSTTGVNSTPDESASAAGAAYVFTRSGGVWTQQAYLKASNPVADDSFGASVAVSGGTVLVGAPLEDSGSVGINSSPNNNATDAGAAYVFTGLGVSANPEINIQGESSSITIANGDTTPSSGDDTQFISTLQGGSSTRTFVIQNTGSAQLDVSAITFTGTHAADFSINGALPPYAVAASGSRNLSIGFTPSGIGMRTATLSIASNDADENPYTFAIQGNGSNLAPTDIALTNSIVAENAGANAVIGTLSSTDANPGQSHTYSLVSGAGSTHNASFNISGNSLRLTASADFESQSSYSVRIQSDDGSGGTFQEVFPIVITNVNEVPSFTKGADQTLPTGSSTAQTVSGWATAINDGDSTVTQGLTFNVSNDNNALFTTQPAIASSGTLTYTPNGTAGSATVSVSLTDDATINGNAALTSAVQTFTITVAAAPQVSIAATTPIAVEGGATGLYTFTRTLTAGALVANFQLNAGSSASATTDFTLSGATTFDSGTGAGTITFPDTQATVTVTLTALTEAVNAAEVAETARLNVASGSGYTIGSPADATVTITANSFLVTTTADSGTGSLRQAIDNANAIAGANAITFSDGTGGSVNFTDGTADIIDLATALPNLSSDISISGTGADKLTIRRPSGSATQFRIFNVTFPSVVNLTGLTITGGYSNNTNGGGIANNGTLSVTACVISGNVTSTLNNGGGIANSDRLTVRDSTISGNESRRGGGIYSNTDGAPFTASDTVTILINTTLSGNSVTGSGAYGGGFCNFDGLSYLVNCTITGNSAPAPSANPLQTGGGGVATFGDNLTVTRFANTLVVGNIGSDVDFMQGTINSNISLGGNLIGTGNSSANFTGQTTTAAANTILDTTLANNGGTTPTHALVSGSPALNAGINAIAVNPADAIFGDGNDVPLTTDQRGPGFARVIGTVDIGAFEGPPAPEIHVTGNGTDIPNGDTTPATADHTDFDSTAVTSGTVVRTFTIQNTGTAALHLTSVTAGSDFTVGGITLPAVVNASSSTTFTVTFDPSTIGLRTTTLSVGNDDANDNPYTFTIQGTGANSLPTNITLSSSSLAENAAANASIGTFSSTDADGGDTHIYTLVAGTGGTDNVNFNLSGNTLRLTASADFEMQSSYSVRIQTSDGTDTFAKAFIITVNDVNETPSFIKGSDKSHPALTNTAQSFPAWATAFDDGDSTVTQMLTFHVTNNNNALFTNQPAVASDGTLTYTLNGTEGTAIVSVSLTDDNTINGDAALTSAVQTFTITITGTSSVTTVKSLVGDVITGASAPDTTGADGGAKFDQLKRGGFLGDNGHLVFPGELIVGIGGVTASPNNFMGLWKDDGTGLKLLARSGDPAPEAGGAVFDILPTVPAINDSGEVTFLASLALGAGTPSTTTSNDTGLWSELGGTGLQILIREDDDIPGLPAGTKVGKFVSGAFATAKTGPTTGEAAFCLTMKGTSTDSAILRTSIGTDTTAVGVVAREGATAPGTGQNFGTLAGSYTDSMRMDATGNLLFAALLTAPSRESLWYQPVTGGALEKVFMAGDVAPDTGGATFKNLKSPAIGSGGVITFRGQLNNNGDNVANTRNDGIWRGTVAGGFSSILRRGDSGYAGMPGGSKVGNVWHGWLNNANHGAWRAWLDVNGDGVVASTASGDVQGIFTDITGAMELAVAVGDAAPGIPGATFASMDLPVVGSDAGGGVEWVVFIGKVTGGGTTAGVNDLGIWRKTDAGAFQLVIRAGETVTTTEGSKVVQKLDFPGAGSTDRRWEQPVMDNTGRLLVHVQFLDGSTSQVLAP